MLLLQPDTPMPPIRSIPPGPAVAAPGTQASVPAARKRVSSHSTAAGAADLAGLITRQREPLSLPAFSQGQLQRLNRGGWKYYGPQTSPQKVETE